MLIKRNFEGLEPAWKLIKRLSVKQGPEGSGSFKTIKKVYIKTMINGTASFVQVFNNNDFGNVNQQHPFWEHALDSEFKVQDSTNGTLNNGISSALYDTFWSTGSPPNGSYLISDNSARININTINTTYTPQSGGDAIYTSESRNIFCNFISGSRVVTTFVSADLNPYNRVDVDGVSVRWNISAPGFTQANTTINLVNPLNSTQFEINRNAQATGTAIIPTITRTYKSGYTPITPAYYSFYGLCRMISKYELNVSPGQIYEISTSCISGTINANTRWGINAYTSSISGNAQPFAEGSAQFQSSTYGAQSDQAYSITIPSGHYYLRVGLFVEHNSTSSTNSPPATPQWGRFNYLRVTRTS